jgi:hypothetical protein
VLCWQDGSEPWVFPNGVHTGDHTPHVRLFVCYGVGRTVAEHAGSTVGMKQEGAPHLPRNGQPPEPCRSHARFAMIRVSGNVGRDEFAHAFRCLGPERRKKRKVHA